MKEDLSTLYDLWVQNKEIEKKASTDRRNIEDKITELLNIGDDFVRSKSINEGPYKVKINGSMSNKIDIIKLKEIAFKNDSMDYLQELFRWKAEIKKTSWDSAEESIKILFSDAIETKPNRPTFSIVKEG